MMNNPQWNQFQMWLQNQINMGQISPYLPQQQIILLYQKYVFNNYGYIPPIPPMPTMQPIMPIQPITPQSTMSSSMPSIQPVSTLQPVTPSSQPLTIISQSAPRNQQTENKIKELIPRGKNDQTIDMGRGPNLMNITLNASTGNKTVINANPETTIENLLKMYTQKLGLPEATIGKEIMFLYNGAQLDFKSQSPIGSLFRNTAVITVYDLGGIIGA